MKDSVVWSAPVSHRAVMIASRCALTCTHAYFCLHSFDEFEYSSVIFPQRGGQLSITVQSMCVCMRVCVCEWGVDSEKKPGREWACTAGSWLATWVCGCLKSVLRGEWEPRSSLCLIERILVCSRLLVSWAPRGGRPSAPTLCLRTGAATRRFSKNLLFAWVQKRKRVSICGWCADV